MQDGEGERPATERLGEVAKRVLDGVKGDRLSCPHDGQAGHHAKVRQPGDKLKEKTSCPTSIPVAKQEVGVCRPGGPRQNDTTIGAAGYRQRETV